MACSPGRFVYLIQSDSDPTKWYVGNTDDVARRFAWAEKLKDDIDHYFPAGTPQRQFAEWSDKWAGWHTVSDGKEQLISIGQVPSHVWYCGPWEVGVSVSFDQDRVSATKVSSWGVNCP